MKQFSFYSISLVLLLATTCYSADTLILKNGKSFDVQFVKQENGYIYYKRNGTIKKMKEELVDRIEVEDYEEEEYETEHKKASTPTKSHSLGNTDKTRLGNESTSSQKRNFEFTMKFNYDFSGKHYYDSTGIDVDNAVSIGSEIIKYTDKIGIGVGFTKQSDRKLETDNANAKFSFLPIYAIAKQSYTNDSLNITPFAEVHLGYNFINGNSDYTASDFMKIENGIYYGIGGGLNLSKFLFLELFYSVNRGKISPKDNLPQPVFGTITYYSFDIEYRKFSFILGLSFGK